MAVVAMVSSLPSGGPSVVPEYRRGGDLRVVFLSAELSGGMRTFGVAAGGDCAWTSRLLLWRPVV